MSIFFSAVEAHISWKVRLNDYVNGMRSERLDPAEIACDDRCELGKWIYANFAKFKEHPTFLAVHRDHAEFHKTAAEIVELYHAGQLQHALDNLNGHYTRISRKVVTGITRLAGEIEGKEATAAETP